MGQQQLILLVLATVIVGLATVVGIRAFSENSNKANADAMLQDAIRIANDVQAARQKPAPLGGIAAFTDANFGALGYASDANARYNNINGSFKLTAAANGVTIAAQGPDSTSSTNEVSVVVCGLTDSDIDGEITKIGGQTTGNAAPTCP